MLNSNQSDIADVTLYALNQAVVRQTPILDAVLRIIEQDWEIFDDVHKKIIKGKIKDIKSNQLSIHSSERIGRILRK